MSILVRYYAKKDYEQIAALHARQNLGYKLPDINDASVVVKAVIEVDGVVTDAAFLRKTAEAYWIFDPNESTRRDRLGSLLILQKELLLPAKCAGFSDVHCWLPPQVMSDKKAVATMETLGWRKAAWTSYAREVG